MKDFQNPSAGKNGIKDRPDYYITPTRDFKQYTKDSEEKYWSKETAFDWSQSVHGNLKHHLETEWVPTAQDLLEIDADNLPILWDCDFLLGPKKENGEDTYVLCEINVSSVAPYPASAVSYIVDATAVQLRRSRQRRGFTQLSQSAMSSLRSQ